MTQRHDGLGHTRLKKFSLSINLGLKEANLKAEKKGIRLENDYTSVSEKLVRSQAWDASKFPCLLITFTLLIVNLGSGLKFQI